jgi:hypothetical protein
MQSNTVEVENQSINVPNFSVEKKTYKSDPFTIRDGRYVGSDGFVIPRDFEEFYQRFPDYVRKWVSKHADRSAPKQDVEDWTPAGNVQTPGGWHERHRANVRPG